MTIERQEASFSILTEERGKQIIRVVDRLGVDDIYEFMVQREIHRLLTGEDEGDDINPNHRDFVIKEAYFVG